MTKSTQVYGFYTHHMARAYEPGGHIPLKIGKNDTFTYGPNPGGDLEILDCFPGPVLTLQVSANCFSISYSAIFGYEIIGKF